LFPESAHKEFHVAAVGANVDFKALIVDEELSNGAENTPAGALMKVSGTHMVQLSVTAKAVE
jgi:hypothetical protein